MKRRVFARGVDVIWEADLVEMQRFAKQNGGYKCILMIIDNSIEDKNWSGSNESLSKFVENAKTTAKIMDIQS